MSDDRTEIAATLDAINLAWVEGRYAEMAPHVHEDVIILAPGAPEVRGREAFIASYAEFGTSAKIHDFSPDPPVIESWGSTAVAYCPFSIDYEITSGRYRERGVDILVFLRAANRWQVCWRTLSAHPEQRRRPIPRRASPPKSTKDPVKVSTEHPVCTPRAG